MTAIVIPAALLGGIAARQIALTRTDGLTPWKGGGFGMFATLDHIGHRRVRIVVDAPDRSQAIDPPPSLDTVVANAVALPTYDNLVRLARAVAADEHRAGRAATRVSVEIWRTSFDPATLQAVESRLRALSLNVPPS